jgi:predicted Zn finger-like uncharacterized protein
MKIQCPNCQHEGTVPDDKVPATGITAKCPKCKTCFQVAPPSTITPKTDFYCPKCGTGQPVSVACTNCGIIFSVYRADQRKKETKSIIEREPISSTPTQKDTKPCPLCGEEILSLAKKCKHCKSMLDVSKDATPVTNFNQTNQSASMLWDSEDEDFICVRCPKCNKDSKINKKTVLTTGSGCYSVNGIGTCSCGFSFDRINREDKEKSIPLQKAQTPIQSNKNGRLTVIGYLGIWLGALFIYIGIAEYSVFTGLLGAGFSIIACLCARNEQPIRKLEEVLIGALGSFILTVAIVFVKFGFGNLLTTPAYDNLLLIFSNFIAVSLVQLSVFILSIFYRRSSDSKLNPVTFIGLLISFIPIYVILIASIASVSTYLLPEVSKQSQEAYERFAPSKNKADATYSVNKDIDSNGVSRKEFYAPNDKNCSDLCALQFPINSVDYKTCVYSCTH